MLQTQTNKNKPAQDYRFAGKEHIAFTNHLKHTALEALQLSSGNHLHGL
jgi:hypothetical protein